LYRSITSAVMVLMMVGVGAASGLSPSKKVVFNRDIRPILSDKCFACHGPDRVNRTTTFRLDRRESVFESLPSGGKAVVPGDLKSSVLVERITSRNPARRMPPFYQGHAPLTKREIDLISKWVSQGAEWQEHWSFIVPRKTLIPEHVTNTIDYFISQYLGRDALSLSVEATKETLIRRVTLDLTGLPPTLAEIDAFLEDHSPYAYEKVVDRLLDSPRYGERMAYRWLDVARYADTNGYQNDRTRDMWRWRDWVIAAFNDNMPFDRFTIEQLAGDLLPDPTLDQLIATGFNRNHRGNTEGGIVPEEYHVEYVVDRAETTATVWMGLTMGCARCHDHKYDPITQKEFYQFYSYFNNVPDRGRYFKYGNTPPIVTAPTQEQNHKLALINQRLDAARKKYDILLPEIHSSQRKWEKSIAESERQVRWFYERDLMYRFPLKGTSDSQYVNLPNAVLNRIGEETRFNGKEYIDLGDRANFSFYDKFSVAAWINPTTNTGGIVTRMRPKDSGKSEKGWGLYLKDGKLFANMAASDDDRVTVETSTPLTSGRHHVAMTYDGSRLAAGIRLFVDGRESPLRIIKDHSNNDFKIDDGMLRVGHGPQALDRFCGYIHDVRIYKRQLNRGEVALVATSESVDKIAHTPFPDRTASEKEKIERAFLTRYASKKILDTWRTIREIEREREELVDTFPTVMVMSEMDPPRETRLLKRGSYDTPGEIVNSAIPGVFSGSAKSPVTHRLDLARWLVDRSNPLTARVTVNRFWQMLFGTGLVASTEDFGSQGEWPTHPELLDWLAVEFMETGWNVKKILKTIVLSQTYRQSSTLNRSLSEKDPENRLLARSSRIRLSAGALRDQALAIAGLLVEQQGGASVRPYQPAGLWKELSNWDTYEHDRDDNLYRRSLYTFWKRTIAPPSMLIFDASDRETCVVRESRTNTPLQALNLMNDTTYVEAARKLAERMMRQGGSGIDQRLEYGFRLATSRMPMKTEREVLLQSFYHYLERYKKNPEHAEAYLNTGESSRDMTVDLSNLAAYTAVSSLILNLDETVTRE